MTEIWRVTVPAWGERCVRMAREVAIPSIVAAARNAARAVQVYIWTDQPEAFRGVCKPLYTDVRRLPSMRHDLLNGLHRLALREAAPGDYVAPFCADQCVSAEFFSACERRFSEGKRIIACAATRTLEGAEPPIGASAARLADFICAHPHQTVRHSLWPTGTTRWPSVVYVTRGTAFGARMFHAHIAALEASGSLHNFAGSIDGHGLIEQISPDRIHVVTDPDEMVIAEVSPEDGVAFLFWPRPNDEKMIAAWARITKPIQHWMFSHLVMLRGEPDDLADCDPGLEILRLIRADEAPRVLGFSVTDFVHVDGMPGVPRA